MTMHIDKRGIIDVWPIVEAHCEDGTGEFDGLYCISYLLAFRKNIVGRTAFYKSEEERDEAFVALGKKVQEAEDEHAAEHTAHQEPDDDEGESHEVAH
jgi:hypothetical protein